MSLENLRRQVDDTDKQIIKLLNKRAEVILEIASQKQKVSKSVYCPERETQVLKRIALLNQGPLPQKALEAIYREVMSSSLNLENPPKIAYLGPQATFSHQAALKKFGTLVDYVPCDSIAAVFSEVEKDHADYGVVPIENSIEGAVNYTLDMFVDSELKICSQIVLDITHNVLSKVSLKQIKQVYSNPMVFGQCRIWLQKNLPCAEHIEASSTTRAAEIAAKKTNSACIASLLAANIYGLKIVARNIEDSPHNITRFLVIGKIQAAPTGKDKTSLLFSIKDKVGALHDMLMPFKKYNVNLSKIESRPSKRKAWDYYFYMDIEGHQEEPQVKKALAELDNKCKFFKVLGSYPVGE